MIALLSVLIHIVFIIRILLRPYRAPESRAAWILVILLLPYVGLIAYLLLGETNIGRKRTERMSQVLKDLPEVTQIPGYERFTATSKIQIQHNGLFDVGQSISGFAPVSGNQAQLMGDSNAAIDSMVADIDAATDHVHLIFYIWMPDNNGRKIAEALKRAVVRGVTCRAMVDDLGSHLLIKSDLWQAMEAAGVQLGRALPIGNPLMRILNGRIDLRNHRKIFVIDNTITYCGSQNCADPEFLTKAKYGPWVDAVMRFTGPIVRQNQYIFASDWMVYVNEDITDVLTQPMAYQTSPGFTAQVVATGPTGRNSAASEMFVSLMYSAHKTLFVTTPYYVPIGSMQAALCAAANRGVNTTVIFPAHNDDFAVGATSRSYYGDLLAAGVKIFEYKGGLLHTKSMTIDGEITFIGSANMDRRSFDLNYENNILLLDPDTTAEMQGRQESYLTNSIPVSAKEVAAWPRYKRIWNNALAIVGPIL